MRACVRAGACRRSQGGSPCRRLFETEDEVRDALSARLEALAAGRPPLTFSSEAEENAHFAAMYRMLQERVRDR